jgi:hypothetical protein
VQLGRVASDLLQRVDASDPHVQLVSLAQLLDGLAEAVGDLSLALQLYLLSTARLGLSEFIARKPEGPVVLSACFLEIQEGCPAGDNSH